MVRKPPIQSAQTRMHCLLSVHSLSICRSLCINLSSGITAVSCCYSQRIVSRSPATHAAFGTTVRCPHHYHLTLTLTLTLLQSGAPPTIAGTTDTVAIATISNAVPRNAQELVVGRYNFMHQMRRHCILKVPITPCTVTYPLHSPHGSAM